MSGSRLAKGLAAVLLLAVFGCSSVPSYEGGPESDQPYGIVQPEGDLKLWAVDGKPAYNKDSQTYAAPGNHTFRFRVDYPMSNEEQHPYEYIDFPLSVTEGHRYRVAIRGEYEKGPPYALDVIKETKIAGYGK
ncbi:MAG: hypothetical protein ACAI25_03265 [Planctomycetota bacterium]